MSGKLRTFVTLLLVQCGCLVVFLLMFTSLNGWTVVKRDDRTTTQAAHARTDKPQTTTTALYNQTRLAVEIISEVKNVTIRNLSGTQRPTQPSPTRKKADGHFADGMTAEEFLDNYEVVCLKKHLPNISEEYCPCMPPTLGE